MGHKYREVTCYQSLIHCLIEESNIMKTSNTKWLLRRVSAWVWQAGERVPREVKVVRIISQH